MENQLEIHRLMINCSVTCDTYHKRTHQQKRIYGKITTHIKISYCYVQNSKLQYVVTQFQTNNVKRYVEVITKT